MTLTDATSAASRTGRARPLALAYVRVSTIEQATSGASLASQEAVIRAEVERRGWDLEVIRDEGKSAKTITGRPLLVDALARLDRGDADALVAVRLDRLSRSIIDFLPLIDRAQRFGWAILLLDSLGVDTSNPSGRLQLGITALVAQHEREMISLRTREGMAQRKAEGVKFGRPRSIPDDVRQRIVRERASGMTLTAIADALTSEGVPTGHGGLRWYPATVSKVLASITTN